jgi:hypothetical protein
MGLVWNQLCGVPPGWAESEPNEWGVRQRVMQTPVSAWLISHQPAILFSPNKPVISNQPAVLFSQNKSVSAISQPNRLKARQGTGWWWTQQHAQRALDDPLYRVQEHGTQGTTAHRGRETAVDIDGHGDCGPFLEEKWRQVTITSGGKGNKRRSGWLRAGVAERRGQGVRRRGCSVLRYVLIGKWRSRRQRGASGDFENLQICRWLVLWRCS